MATICSTGRRCCQPFSRATFLVLTMSGLLFAVYWFLYIALKDSLPEDFKIIFSSTNYVLSILLPVIGWVAESWLGRYRAIVVGLLMTGIITALVVLLSFIMLHLDMTPIPAVILAFTFLMSAILCFGAIYTVILPFTLDQMIGASAEDLSAVVQWYCWGLNIAQLINHLLLCMQFIKQLQLSVIYPIILLALASVSLCAVLLMDCLFHKWLDTRDKTGNPIKLIFQVLNYARRNKCPRLRSAFTYIDEEQPSRLDFGKHKFGGPFTEEEVEDVKTVFRLTPIVFVYGLAFFTVEVSNQFELHAVSTSKQTFECVSNTNINVFFLTSFILIPIYRLGVYPLVRKCLPSMLKIVGVGLILCFVSMVSKLAIESVGHFGGNASQCIFDDNVATGTIPIPLYWVLIIDMVNGVGVLVTMCSVFEFVMAQAPNRMRGIMMGLTFTSYCFIGLGHYLLVAIFHQFQAATPSCVFYYYLVLSIFVLLAFVIYVTLAKHYKLRERDRHINIHVIVEEHYERYFDQEEEYMRNCSQ